MIYTDKIDARLSRLPRNSDGAASNAVGTEANFSCGSFVRFKLGIDSKSSVVTNSAFSSNGCGYMLAAADLLAETVKGKHLADLHGLGGGELSRIITAALGEIPGSRRDCLEASITSFRAAFADFRSRQIEEFRGEKPLICTCFGITEEAIETLIETKSLTTVDQVARVSNAGSGCGSCRMLIQELLDN